VKRTPLDDENCSPFTDTATTREPAPLDDGARHTTRPPAACLASTVVPLEPNRHRHACTTHNAAPDTVTSVPPATGPADGAAELTCIAACT
jgi:hypothetical protein